MGAGKGLNRVGIGQAGVEIDQIGLKQSMLG